MKLKKITDLDDRELQQAILGNLRRMSSDLNVIKVIIVVIIAVQILAGIIVASQL